MFNLLSTRFLGFILINFLQTSSAQQNPTCVDPSSCGNIQNISYPFRLRGDPPNCGNPDYELACENNFTILYLYSQRYFVQAINYHNYTIRLADASITNDTCSFPQYSLYDHFNSRDSRDDYPFGLRNYSDTQLFFSAPISLIVTFLSCPNPVNYSLYINADICGNDSLNSSNRTYTYVRVGRMNVSDLVDTCRIDTVVMLSMPFRNYSNISLSELHFYLRYGFELSWFSVLCDNCRGIGTCEWDGSRANCRRNTRGTCVVYNNLFPCDAGGIVAQLTKIQWIVADIGPRIFLVANLALRVVIGMPIFLVLLICKCKRRHLSMFDGIEGFLRSQNNLLPNRYSHPDIKKMTKGFREKLGQGGYGSVYKGKLRSGRDVAVKVLSSKAKASGQDFINEVATIGRIHHVNVVKLVGYSAELSKRALIYDFMPNGSLEKYVLGKEKIDILDWKKKFEIAVGVARGIEYLHRGCDIQILHFDIKPHNILLDENFIPKISDFGLAKFYSTDHNTVTLTAARGTIGYVAPELINRSIGSVTYKADVYSFGMMLMEMVGLKKDLVENADDSSMYFPYWIYLHLDKWKEKDIEIGKVHVIASSAGVDDDEKLTRKMAIVALWCIQMSPGDRPSMSKVVEMLEGEVGILQIPPRPSYAPKIPLGADQTWGTDETDSTAWNPYGTSRDISSK